MLLNVHKLNLAVMPGQAWDKVAPAGASEPTTTTGDGYTQDIFHQNACQMRDPDTVLVAADRLKE